MVSNVGDVLAELDPAIRAESRYVSKMVAAATVGLFDAALNYLWDELVSALRSRVAGFDLAYFFDIAAGSNSDLRKSLKTEGDLPNIDDARLLRSSLEIGLITDVGFARLDHIRYMRNHPSAAHPNQNALTGLELITFLQLCIREVIPTPTDTVTAHTGRLLANIKKDVSTRQRSTLRQRSSISCRRTGPTRSRTVCSAYTPRRTAPRPLPTTSGCCGRAYGRSSATPLAASTACGMPAQSRAPRQDSQPRRES
jgi:hypothetical protein